VREMCAQSSGLPCLEISPVNNGRYYCIMCCLYEMIASQKAPEEERIMYCLPNIVLVAVDLVAQRKGVWALRGNTPCRAAGCFIGIEMTAGACGMVPQTNREMTDLFSSFFGLSLNVRQITLAAEYLWQRHVSQNANASYSQAWVSCIPLGCSVFCPLFPTF